MGKRKLNPVAEIVNRYDLLTDVEKEIAFDLIRSKQPSKVKAKSTVSGKSSQKRKTQDPKLIFANELKCQQCGRLLDENIHQLTTAQGYHEFKAENARAASGD